MRHIKKLFLNAISGIALAVVIIGIITSIALPHSAAAVSEVLLEREAGRTPEQAPESGINRYPPEYQSQAVELDQATQPGTASKGDIVKAGCNIFSEGPGCVIYWVLDALSDLIVTTFVSLAALAFDYVIQYAVNIDLASTAFVSTGFGITIGVANMFFVLILLWIAIATIFDFEPYTARSLLPKLIIAALLINFSLAIGNSFIRLSNGIARIFYNNLTQIPSGAGVKTLPGTEISLALSPIAARVMEMSQYAVLIDTSAKTQKASLAQKRIGLDEIIKKGKCKTASSGVDADISPILIGCEGSPEITAQQAEDAWNERFSLPQSEEGTLLTAMQAIFWKLLMVPVIIFVLFAGIIFIIIRELSLAFILVLGPMAFLFMILPATQRFYNQWWEKLTQWSFFLPAFTFFLLLSLRVGAGILPAQITSSDDRLPVMFQYFMTIGLLIGSLIVANQMGIWGASTVTGWGRKMAGAAGGWAKGTGKIWGGAALRRGLLDTRIGRAIAGTPYARALLRPVEAAAVAGQKVKDAREKAAIQRRAMAAKAAPQYRWALMQGMAESEKADFVRELKPHQLKQTLELAAVSSRDRMNLYKVMQKYELEDKVLDAAPDLTAVVEIATQTERSDPRFQEAFISWFKSAPKSELQKRITANDIQTNELLQQALLSRSAAFRDITDIANTREKAVALGEWFVDLANVRQQVEQRIQAGMTRAEAMRETDVVGAAAEFFENPRVKEELQSSPITLKIEHGIALGKRIPKREEEAVAEEAPPPPPPAPPTP